VLQKIPAGSNVLSTIIVLQRGQVVVKVASACRGCPFGTLPADAAAFAKAQLAQAGSKGLPRTQRHFPDAAPCGGIRAVTRAPSLAILVVVSCALCAASALARPAGTPTIAACVQKDKTPGDTNPVSKIMDCLLPKSIVVSGTASWTNCPSAPADEPECYTGVITVTFRSTASGIKFAPGLVQPEPWGGTTVASTPGGTKGYNPTWAIWGLPGTGTFTCTVTTIDLQNGFRSLDYNRTIPLRDQAMGLVVFGPSIRFSSSVHPGFHGPLGRGAIERVFGTEGCVIAAFRPGETAVRTQWPGTLVRATSLLGASPVVRIRGTQRLSIPSMDPSLAGGPTIAITYRWSSTFTLRPAPRG
jgi:hypothetical protein